MASPIHSLPPPETVWGLVPEPGSGMMLESDERSASRVRGLLRTLILAPPRDSSTTDQALEGIETHRGFLHLAHGVESVTRSVA